MSTTQDNSEVLLTIDDIADRYGVCRKTVFNWLNSGAYPQPIRIGRRYVRWRLQDVIEFEQLNK